MKTKAKKVKAFRALLGTPAERIYKVAEYFGIPCVDVLRHEDCRKATGLTEELLSGPNAQRADQIRREKTRELQQALEARNQRIREREESRYRSETVQVVEEAPDGAATEPEPTPAVKETPEAPKPPRKKKKAREKILFDGFAITNVVRKLGSLGWTVEETAFVLGELGVCPAVSTIRVQIKAGQRGERGEPAAISDKGLSQLKKLRKKFKK